MKSACECKNETIKLNIIIVLICEASSIFFIGFDMKFALGLAIGAAVASINMNILFSFVKTSVNNSWGIIFNLLGYVVRMIIYGIALYFSIKISNTSAIGTIIGFIGMNISMFLAHGINIMKSRSKRQVNTWN